MGFQEVPEIACIHGRFQPFHYGHINYLKAALKHYPRIVIGLTAVTPVENVSELVVHRANFDANPLNYWERMVLINAVLKDIGIPKKAVSYVPFPIDEPENLKFIIPQSTICLTTDLYEWNREKIGRLENYGYTTQILRECVKVDFDGSMIRKSIIDSTPEWKQWVTPSAVQLLELWGIRNRLLQLNSQDIDIA